MKKNILIALIALFGATLSITDVEAKGLKEKIADSYYNKLAYHKAIPYYVELAKSKKVTADILRKTADCYNKVGNTEQAIYWYRELYDKADWVTTQDKYEYFLTLRKGGKYETSLLVMKSYLADGGVATDFIKYLQENPNYVEDLKKKNADKYTIKTLPFNSAEHDFGATYYEKGILFASPEKRGERRAIPRKFDWDNTNFLQLYYVAKEGNSDKYTEPKAFTLAKKDKFHDGPISFNSDFTEAYLTRSNYSPKGKLKKSKNGTIEVNLYISKKQADGKWSKIEPFAYNSSEYSTGCATLSKDGQIMVFASDMPGGVGQTDLWMCKRDENGNWGTPSHLGEKINTSRRDNYPWLDKDGNLYFASDGGIHGLGGYDVFWIPGFLQGRDKVYNVGAPINSEADDFGFVYNSDDATGYFNSGRNGVVGEQGRDDIFAFDKLVSLLEVQIIDKATKQPITKATGCLQSEFNDEIESGIALDEEARYTRELPAKTYIVCGNAEGYKTGTTKVILPKGKFVTAVVELEKEVAPTPTLAGKPCPQIELEDIYYDFDKYVIRNDASAALDELLAFLKEHPDAKINLTSHTDSRGTHKYNDWLSQKRAESAVNYLAERGIARDRMTARGAGERELVNGCSDGVRCTERQHQANRRTVVELVMQGCIEVSKIYVKFELF